MTDSISFVADGPMTHKLCQLFYQCVHTKNDNLIRLVIMHRRHCRLTCDWLTCQLISRNLVRLVFESSTLTNAYMILPLFSSSVSSNRPPSPLPINFKQFVCPSYPYSALNQIKSTERNLNSNWHYASDDKPTNWYPICCSTPLSMRQQFPHCFYLNPPTFCCCSILLRSI